MSTSHAIIVLHTALDTVRSEQVRVNLEISRLKNLLQKEEERLVVVNAKLKDVESAIAKVEAAV